MAHQSFYLALLIIFTLDFSAGQWCPALGGLKNTGPKNVRLENDTASEFPCTEAKWNKEELRNTIDDIFKNKPRKFLRFRAPQQVTGENRMQHITWIWVAKKYNYMLYYPHNFQMLALSSTYFISRNTKEDGININCTGCEEGVACGVGFFELKEVIENVTQLHNLEWDYLCVEADNGVEDIISSQLPKQFPKMFNTRNCALPDILYQSRFLKLFFSHCSFLSLACRNVSNHFCYTRDNHSCDIHLLHHYPKIIYLSVLLWLFIPLLVIYLPSSRPVYSIPHIPGMFPTHKTPVYLGRFIKKCLCYNTTVADRNRPTRIQWRRALGFFLLSTLLLHFLLLPAYQPFSIIAFGLLLTPIQWRRALGFCLLSTLSFRFLLLPAYQPFSFIVFGLFLITALWPQHLSVYINPDVPHCFPLFRQPYPEGLVRLRGSGDHSKEYQRLAYIMLERMYLPFDYKFWCYVCENSFERFHIEQQTLEIVITVVVGVVKLCLSVIIVLTYFIVPFPYFSKELFWAISSGTYATCQNIWTSQKMVLFKLFEIFLSFIHGSILSILLLYLILTLFSLCFLLTEVTIFTYLGASIGADIVNHYIVLLVAFASTVYAIVHSIHKQYLSILKDTAQIMENDSEIEYIHSLIKNHVKTSVLQKTANGKDVYLIDSGPSHYRKGLYQYRYSVNHLNTRFYFSIVESVRPIRRQVFLAIVKVLLMLFFIMLTMWTKNVYKNEGIVSDVFSVAQNMAILFIPAVLEWFSGQRNTNKAQQKIDIMHAIVDYAQKELTS